MTLKEEIELSFYRVAQTYNKTIEEFQKMMDDETVRLVEIIKYKLENGETPVQLEFDFVKDLTARC